MDKRKRRSSILKSQPPPSMVVVPDEVTGGAARRRVSFSAMRTVKEFDLERNAMLSPHDEPLKFLDTGSSDGLNTTQSSQGGSVTMDTTTNSVMESTADFFSRGVSMPSMRNGLSLRDASGDGDVPVFDECTANVFGAACQPGAEDDSQLGEAPMDISGATLTGTDLRQAVGVELNCSSGTELTFGNTRTLFGKSAPNPNDTTFGNNTRMLFGKSPLGSRLCSDQVDMSMSSEGVSRSEMTIEPTMALFTPQDGANEEQTDNIFAGMEKVPPQESRLEETTFLGVDAGASFADMSQAGISFAEESHNFTFVNIDEEGHQKTAATPPAYRVPKDGVRDAGDSALLQQIAALEVDPSPARPGTTRFADSPMAVVKKKTRITGPLRMTNSSFTANLTTTPDRSCISRLSGVEKSMSEQSPVPSRVRATGTTPVHTPEEVSQKLSMARRRLRRSLDKQLPPLNLQMSDIVIPSSGLFDLSTYDSRGLDDRSSAVCEVGRDQSSVSQLTTTETVLGGDTVSKLSVVMTALTENYASLDFDPAILELTVVDPDPTDSAVVARIKEVVLTGTRRMLEQDIVRDVGLIQTRLSETTTSGNNAFTMADLGNLNPKAMSRRELHVLEASRLDAQRDWYVLRNEIISGALKKTEEVVKKEAPNCEEKQRNAQLIREYHEARHEEDAMDEELAERKQMSSKMAREGNSEAVESEVTAARREARKARLANKRLLLKKLKLEEELLVEREKKLREVRQMQAEKEQARDCKRREWQTRVDELLSKSK